MTTAESQRQTQTKFRYYSLAIEHGVRHAGRLLFWANDASREFRIVVDERITIDPRTELHSLLDCYSRVAPCRGSYQLCIVEQGARTPCLAYGIGGVNSHDLGERLIEKVLDDVAHAIGSMLVTGNIQDGVAEVSIPEWERHLLPDMLGGRYQADIVRERLQAIPPGINDIVTAHIRQERLLVLGKMDAEHAATRTGGDITNVLRDTTIWAVEELKRDMRATAAANSIRGWRKHGRRFPGTSNLAEQLGLPTADVTQALATADDLREWAESPFLAEEHLKGAQLRFFWFLSEWAGQWWSYDRILDHNERVLPLDERIWDPTPDRTETVYNICGEISRVLSRIDMAPSIRREGGKGSGGRCRLVWPGE